MCVEVMVPCSMCFGFTVSLMILLMIQGDEMDASRGILYGTMDRFKVVSRRDYQHPVVQYLLSWKYAFSWVGMMNLCDLIRCLRPNQAGGCLRSSHHLWSFSLSFTIWLGKCTTINEGCVKNLLCFRLELEDLLILSC